MGSSIAGSTGNWVLKDFETFGGATETTIDSAIIERTFANVKELYAGYGTELAAYETEATTYNKAADGYNEEVKAQELDKPTTLVPRRPCPPSKIDVAWAGLLVDTENFATDAYPTAGGLEARPTDSADAAKNRVGQLATQAAWVFGTDAAMDTSDITVAHVFGRLGQGEGNKPGVAPFQWTDATTILYTM